MAVAWRSGFVRVGTLDEPARLPPDVHIYTRSKLPWIEPPKDIPAFEAYYDTKAVGPRPVSSAVGQSSDDRARPIDGDVQDPSTRVDPLRVVIWRRRGDRVPAPPTLAQRRIEVIVVERTGTPRAASGKSGGFLALDWCDGTPRPPRPAQLRPARGTSPPGSTAPLAIAGSTPGACWRAPRACTRWSGRL